MAEVAFIGLGIMGAPMAANLVAAGHRVRGYSRTAATRDAAAASGIEPADSAAAAVEGAEFVVTMLPDTPDVLGLLFGSGALADGIAAGATVIDMSTIEPAASVEIAARLDERGISALDAPVSGGQAGAQEGALSIMVGGNPDVFDRSLPLLEAMGTTIVRVGPAGAGQSVKAANQLMVAGHLQMLAEALVFLDSQGVDPELALDVIGGGLAGSTVITRKRRNYLDKNFAPGFRLTLHDKDLGIVARTARAAGLALPATALVSQLVAALVAQGHGGLDHSALHLLAIEMNGGTAK
ncbi:2-hydroxy-3-oxopropionate reductase [Mycobacterium sp. MS1601]|uniref:NAD(P)-dependent oxidoreductase n=1 Tax=Mycobacterium sp. MS1601 TaxID=1936029 RepID=UPI0009796DED|nr:NAD(P)-binding domain-containing protein [Mycobacterium sp. MS1601]AQA01941.1 2-hydroxy-3-oxopropionate reductase [Mycobacterium sp. MS1601]